MFLNGYGIPAKFAGVSADQLLGHNCIVSPSFAVQGRDEEYDHVWDWTDLTPAIWEEGPYEVVGLTDFEPCCVALRHGGKPVGFYMGGQSWIDPSHRGMGLGPVLVLSAIALSGELPDIRDIGFTEAGYRTHLAAVELMHGLVWPVAQSNP